MFEVGSLKNIFFLFFFLAGTKRKSERSDSHDLKRLRPSVGHSSTRSSSNNKRPPAPSLPSSKKGAPSPRGRHPGSSNYRQDYYDDRKARRGPREAPPRSRGRDDTRQRDAPRGLEGLSQVRDLRIQSSSLELMRIRLRVFCSESLRQFCYLFMKHELFKDLKLVKGLKQF